MKKWKKWRKILNKELENIITNYGLVLDNYYKGMNEQRYGFMQQCDYLDGNIIGVNIHPYIGWNTKDDENVMFAEGVDFGRFREGQIACWGWLELQPDQYEIWMKELKRQFDVAMKEYKQYKMNKKLERIGEDFK
jgi:hypothetical protein